MRRSLIWIGLLSWYEIRSTVLYEMLMFIILDYSSRGVTANYLTFSAFIRDTPSSSPLDLQPAVRCIIVRSLSSLLTFFENYAVILFNISLLMIPIM